MVARGIGFIKSERYLAAFVGGVAVLLLIPVSGPILASLISHEPLFFVGFIVALAIVIAGIITRSVIVVLGALPLAVIFAISAWILWESISSSLLTWLLAPIGLADIASAIICAVIGLGCAASD